MNKDKILIIGAANFVMEVVLYFPDVQGQVRLLSYGDKLKSGIPVELQLPVSFVQLLYSTLSPAEGPHVTSKTDAQPG